MKSAATGNERRSVRSTNSTKALTLQLDACRSDGGIDAMLIADEAGMAMAASGPRTICDEVAGRIVLVGAKIKDFHGTLLDHGRRWDVQMTKVQIDGSELLVCAVGGSASARGRQLARSVDGARRILSAA